jgi:hypothetical protein
MMSCMLPELYPPEKRAGNCSVGGCLALRVGLDSVAKIIILA